MFNFVGRDRKLQEERLRQEKLIAEQLKEMNMDHELEYEKLTQRGLVANKEQTMAKEKELELLEKKRLARKGSKTSFQGSEDDTESSTEESKPRGVTNREEMSYIDMARTGYQQLVNLIIRPPRADYESSQLGPSEFTFAGQEFERIDWTLMTARGYHIEVSHWGLKQQLNDEESSPVRPIMIYLHGNASCRLEVLPQLTNLLAMGISVVSMDFAGSGKSDGDYVSLGYFEREDLATIIAHLRRHYKNNENLRIALWGRSMGAATAIMHGAKEGSHIDCMILDSSFSSLVQLAEELVETARQQGAVVPNVVVGAALKMIQWSVDKHAKFNIRDLSPITYASNCNMPALFIHGEQDDFIKQHHSEDICELYSGPKNLLIVKGDHNDVRPTNCTNACRSFLQRHLQVLPEWDLLGGETVKRPLYPPWFQQSKARINNNSAGYDESKMGMTQERQQEIQSSIGTMLGQGAQTKKEHQEEEQVVEVDLPRPEVRVID